MSRTARSVRPGTLQFVLCRFINHGWGLTTESERAHYLTLFGRAMASTDWKCLAYSLLGDRVLFAMIAGSRPLESWTKRVHSPFARWRNKQRSRIGPLFARRPNAREIANENAFELIAFVHNSAVRANFVARAADASLSSHPAYLGGARRPQWLHVAEGLRLGGFADRAAEFNFAVDQLANGELPESAPRLDAPIRTVARVTSEQVLCAVSEVYELPISALQGRRLRGTESAARRVAIHVAQACRVSLAEMGATLGFSRQRASRVASLALTPGERTVANRIVQSLREETDSSVA